jgi:hypothetical protein
MRQYCHFIDAADRIDGRTLLASPR